jgi:hypothetical protein
LSKPASCRLLMDWIRPGWGSACSFSATSCDDGAGPTQLAEARLQPRERCKVQLLARSRLLWLPASSPQHPRLRVEDPVALLL